MSMSENEVIDRIISEAMGSVREVRPEAVAYVVVVAFEPAPGISEIATYASSPNRDATKTILQWVLENSGTARRHIKYADELLQQIAAGVNRLHGTPPALIEVTLLDGDGEAMLVTNLATVLDYIANDTYWDENGDWSECRLVRVESI